MTTEAKRSRPPWRAARIARPVRDLAASSAFYRDVLGLPARGGFRGHDDYDGDFFDVPGEVELELATGPSLEDELLVLYVDTLEQVRTLAAELVAQGVPSVASPNPYWNRFGRTFLDPDGHRVVVAALDRAAPEPFEIGWHDGPRAELRALFELAEDSAEQLDAYVDAGRVLVARRSTQLLGHLQLLPTGHPGETELKNMAVRTDEQGIGIGRALIDAAVAHCRAEGLSRMLVATATADVGNLRFYQRVGFRLLSVERDAFTPQTGYPQPIVIDGIALRDRVWLARELP